MLDYLPNTQPPDIRCGARSLRLFAWIETSQALPSRSHTPIDTPGWRAAPAGPHQGIKLRFSLVSDLGLESALGLGCAGLVARTHALADMGCVRDHGGDKFRAHSDLIAQLEQAEVARAGKKFAAESGLNWRPTQSGDRVSGLFVGHRNKNERQHVLAVLPDQGTVSPCCVHPPRQPLRKQLCQMFHIKSCDNLCAPPGGMSPFGLGRLQEQNVEHMG